MSARNESHREADDDAGHGEASPTGVTVCRMDDGEPDLTTDPALLEVLAELREREPIFHRPELGTRWRIVFHEGTLVSA